MGEAVRTGGVIPAWLLAMLRGPRVRVSDMAACHGRRQSGARRVIDAEFTPVSETHNASGKMAAD